MFFKNGADKLKFQNISKSYLKEKKLMEELSIYKSLKRLIKVFR